MYNKKNRTQFFVVFLLLISGTLSLFAEDHHDLEYKSIAMPEIYKEIQLPIKMWDLVTGAGFEKSVRTATNFMYAPISVRLEEKSSGVLSEPALKIEFPRAGGEIDFAKFIKNDKGSFRIFFDTEAMDSDAEELQVFYISKAKKRKLEDGIYGSGCKSFFDIRKYIQQTNTKEGIVLNVTRDRHASAIGGTVLFSYKKNRQLFVTQVTFTDSRRPDLFCDTK